MTTAQSSRRCENGTRRSPWTRTTFREIGHRLVDEIAEQLEKIPHGPVTRDESPADIRAASAATQPLPAQAKTPAS